MVPVEEVSGCGQKVERLANLLTAGFHIPKGFVVQSDAAEAFFETPGLRRLVDQLSSDDLREDGDAVLRIGERIREAVRSATLPATIEAEIVQAYEELEADRGVPDPPVAVRSSAAVEDGGEASFAGLHDTYLWVRGGPDVVAAVRDCWGSLFGAPAMAYRQVQQVVDFPLSMAVLVQHMVEADVAGVMFTLNPRSGDRSVVAIEASWGLGASVVGGEVTPDFYLISKVTRELLSTVTGNKQIRFVPDHRSRGIQCVPVPAILRSIPCVREEQLIELAEIGIKIERHFGTPQDIEWALVQDKDGSNEPYILQSRPVTAQRASAPTVGARFQSPIDYVAAALIRGANTQ